MNLINEGIRILEFVFKAFVGVMPFLMLSVVIAAGVNQMNFKDKMTSFLKKKSFYAIVVATVVGAVSPLCSCGVIPMIFALFQLGIPLAPIMSFWITSPVMSPSAFFLTWGNLGMEMAWVRLAATIFMGLVSGFVTHKLFPPDQDSTSFLKISLSKDADSCNCGKRPISTAPTKTVATKLVWKKFFLDMKKMTLFLGGWLALAFVLEAFIIFYLPPSFIRTLFGSQNAVSVFWAVVVGIPLYINNISAIPIIGGLLQSGMGKGAALAFLLAGPVTTIPAMVAVFGLVKRKAFVTFLTLGFLLAVFCGYLYELTGILF